MRKGAHCMAEPRGDGHGFHEDTSRGDKAPLARAEGRDTEGPPPPSQPRYLGQDPT